MDPRHSQRKLVTVNETWSEIELGKLIFLIMCDTSTGSSSFSLHLFYSAPELCTAKYSP